MSRRAGKQRDRPSAGESRGNRGQVAVETVAMFVLVVFTIGLLWQAILVGYTALLASRAADHAARETAVHLPGSQAQSLGVAEGRDTIPGAWRPTSDVNVTTNGTYARADVSLRVPLVVPGWRTVPIRVSGSAGATP